MIEEYINLDFVKPDKHCDLCDTHNDYICLECETIQIREKYPNAKQNYDFDWVIEK